MRKTLYLVIYSRRHWWIDCEGKPYGPFDTEAEAVAEGPEFITLMGASGHRNELHARNQDGRFRMIWCSGESVA